MSIIIPRSTGNARKKPVIIITSVSETIRQPPIVKAQTALKTKKYGEKRIEFFTPGSSPSIITKRLVTALILSRLDYCNAVLAGLPQSTLQPLQRVQNAAARLVSDTKPRDHISPSLHNSIATCQSAHYIQTVPSNAPCSR